MIQVPKLVTKNGAVESFKADESVLVHKTLQCITRIDNIYKYILDPISSGNNDIFQVSKDGSLQTELGSLLAPPGQFCLEQFSEDDSQLLAIICSELNAENVQNESAFTAMELINLTAMIISIPFLFMTLIVYALIKKLRNLHGKCLMCHVTSLLVAYASLLTVQFTTNSISKDVCIFFCKYFIKT